MLKTFITSFKIKNTYRVNSIIYSIKGLPIINKILPSSLYKNKFLKIFGNIISILWEIVSTFLWKGLYVWLVLGSMTFAYKTNQADTFLHLFVFSTLIGGILNTYLLNPTKDKYYSIILMKMDANSFALTNYFYSMLKLVIGLMPFTIIFGLILNVPLLICISMPLFVALVKIIVIGMFSIPDFKKNKVVNNENLPTKKVWILLAALVLLGFGLPYLGIVINQIVYIILFSVSIIFGIIALREIITFKDYKKIYKVLLTNENVYAVNEASSTKAIRENVAKRIEYNGDITSNKTGFAYFHELFVKRHNKILTLAIKKQTLVIIGIFLILYIAIFLNPDLKQNLNSLALTYLPYFVFIMYLLNRGTTMTQAMFMNCDHSMLTYRIYRTPKVILGVFKERLKTLISLNLIPATFIGLGLAILLFLTGGTDNNLNYLIIFISIISMSVFFSVHYLVMYYLLQPYNINTEIKNSTYKVVEWLTYFIAYILIGKKIPTFNFGILMSAFCIIYSLISLFIAYKYAPKTFKIRI